MGLGGIGREKKDVKENEGKLKGRGRKWKEKGKCSGNERK